MSDEPGADAWLQAAPRFLSCVVLSGYDVDENDETVEVELSSYDAPRSGTDLLGCARLSAYGTDGFEEALSAYAQDVFGTPLTDETMRGLSAALDAAVQSARDVQDAAAQPWRHRMAKLVNVNAVKNSVRQIFTWIPGERIINPEFGSFLRKYLYEPITDENQERIAAEIRQCVLRWEPRVTVTRVAKVTDVDDVENNTVRLDIHYTIKGLDGQQFVYRYEYSRAGGRYA